MSHFIEWRHDRRRILLPVLVLPPSPSMDLTGFEAVALLDTGSTTSGITPRVARQLGLTKRGKRPLGSAQGEGQAERYLFRIGLHIPSAEPSFPFVFDDVSGFELVDSFSFDGLIGMDILSRCDFEMRRDGRCSLRFG
ncbi:MAG TPA: retropepsin-like aspartic protease [Allosphingosinicella sp.]